jgi:transcriptional regulator with XRE-family HTH domain
MDSGSVGNLSRNSVDLLAATGGNRPVTFGTKAQELMKARGLPLRALARRVPVDPGHLSRVVNDRRAPSADLAQRLDDELGAEGSLAALVDDRLALADENARRVDTAVLDSVAELLAKTRRLEDSTSAATVLPAVREYIAMVERFAAEAPSAVRADAIGLASELNQYAGWLHVPLRRWSVAERLLDRAIVLGMEANDRQRTATALSFGAYTAMRRHQTRKAAALNGAAGRDTGVDLGLRTYIAYQGAEILAGDDNAVARRLLRVAEGMAEKIHPEDLTPSGYWYTTEFFQGTHAFVLDKLGEHDRARELMAESLAALPEEWRNAEWAERRRAFLAA